MQNKNFLHSILNRKVLGRVLLYTSVILIVLIMASPVYILAKISVSSKPEVLTSHPSLFIQQFDFSHWKSIFETGKIWPPLIRSLVVAISTTIISLIIVVPACYSVSRMKKKWRYFFIFSLFFTKMFPGVALALPISVIFLKWNLLDTATGLVLANLVKQIPFMAWILVSTFVAIPKDLDEAALVDGASKMQTIRKVILPIAASGIAVAAMYVFLNAWNEFTFAIYLSNNSKTMPIQIYYFVERGSIFNQATYATVLAIPVIIITFLLQRYLKSGYLSGSVKG